MHHRPEHDDLCWARVEQLRAYEQRARTDAQFRIQQRLRHGFTLAESLAYARVPLRAAQRAHMLRQLAQDELNAARIR